jgi:hypothetical protein
MKRADFIKRLKRARDAVVRGDTGCATAPEKCWTCAMRYRSGETRDGGHFWRFTGPHSDWSINRPKAETLAMFDNSIAALERETPSSGVVTK